MSILQRLEKLEGKKTASCSHEDCLDFIDGRFGAMTEAEFIAKFGAFPEFSSMYSDDELMEAKK